MPYPTSLIRVLALLAVVGLAGCTTTHPPAAATPAQSAPAPTASAIRAEPKPLDEARLNEAKLLKEERRFLEAAAIYEEQARLQPENGNLVALQASMVREQGRAETDPAKAKALNKRARELAERAEKLGTDDPLTPLLLASIQPDGSTEGMVEGAFSKQAAADQLIRDGETAFQAHAFAKARECYQQAAELEPTNYMAALWTGDAYFNARQLEPACEWFRKTVAINPAEETAHRYLGDALAKLGRKDEALNEYIEALLCQPYQRLTRQHFTEELRAPAVAKGRTIPRFPLGRFSVDVTRKEIGIGSQADNIGAIYALACANWRIDKFSQRFLAEKAVRRSLPEEVAGLELLIATGQAVSEKDPKETDATMATEHAKWQPIIDSLTTLKTEGLLEAYALFERVDEDLAKDYAAYRAEHRDTLERYIRLYWCGFE